MKNILILHGDTPAGKAAIEAGQDRGLKVRAIARRPVCPKEKGVQWFHTDSTDEDSVKELAGRFDKSGIFIDVLITCPYSIFFEDKGQSQPFEQQNVEVWEEIIRRNLRPAMLFCKIFGQRMALHREGRIIQLVSNVSVDPHHPKHFKTGAPSAAYAASMGAIQALSRHLASQYQDNGVRINNIIYGPLLGSERKDFIKAYVDRVPLGRIMTIKDLANAIDLLLAPGSHYMTGQNIMVDGGVSIW